MVGRGASSTRKEATVAIIMLLPLAVSLLVDAFLLIF